MKTKEEKFRGAIDKHVERLTQQPHPLTGRPLTVDQAQRRALDVAEAADKKAPLKEHTEIKPS